MGTGTFFFLCCIIVTLPGWTVSCKGRVVLTESSGVISDDDQGYPDYARCEWLIDAGDDRKVVYLEFDFLNTECSYDFLFIFDGDSYQSPKLASLSGYNTPEPILSTGGKMLIYLFSDRNYNREGFQVRYLIQDCPLNCSGNGHCVDHVCVCDTRFSGRGCEMEICPDDCGAHGSCDLSDSVRGCRCEQGYSGYLCNISLNNDSGSEYWYTLAPAGSGFEARSAHAGTFLSHTNCLYIFGGFTLNHSLTDLKKFCFDENRWENITQLDPWPDGRYEHAIVAYKYGFFMFGGVLDNGYSNELWYYNATSETWRLHAENSTLVPRKLSGHTLTLVDEDLYLFGGKTEDGSFWSTIYKISAEEPSDWTEIIPYGGKSSERRLVGHSAVYHKESRSLLIFGGYTHQDQPRFGTHTEKIHAFHIDNKVWSYLQPEKQDGTPSQRSFHSAQIMGNYMVIYGGNTHIHHDNELCYDYEMYLYHLGCHSWVRVSYLMGKYAEEIDNKPPRGRVSHVAVTAYGNLLMVAGGFSGYVRGDLVVFKFPSYVAPPQAEASLDLDFCMNYSRIDKCGYNPECFFCNNISTTNNTGCIHRTQQHLCRETKHYYPKAACPGICASLKTCQECLSQGQGASLDEHSPEKWTYIQPCNWCVKNAECQRRSEPKHTCRDANDTASGTVGWWGGRSASLSQLNQCPGEDFPAGLQAIKYRPMVDMKQPDEVKIIRETTESEKFRYIYTKKSHYNTIKWRGYIHPLNSTIKFLFANSSVIYTFKLMVENISQVHVGISRDDTKAALETIVYSEPKLVNKHLVYEFQYRPRDHVSPIFANTARGSRYYIEVTGDHKYPDHSEQMILGRTMYNLELQWNGIPQTGNSLRNYHTFTSEFLEPYSNGNCDIHNNCLGCMTDALCAWCDLDNSCVPRNISGEGSMCTTDNSDTMLVTDGGVCPVCHDHVDCSSCAQDSLCEWVKDYVICVRRGRVNVIQNVVTVPEECPASCHGRSSCSECLHMRECVWCENLHTCLPFSDYVSRHRHGQCTEWIDSEEATQNPYTCRNCSAKKTCQMCLDTFSCGWCGNTVNPTIGVCAEGDFSGPYGNVTCEAIVSKVHRSVPINESADWSYSKCPDVEECLLGLAKCHKNATCINTPTSYTCTCNRGYVGDGKDSCEKTCYYKCEHGMCLEDDTPGEFSCDCDLGWTGVDCAQDCLCNGHSMCESGPGQCDYCDNNTSGEHCEQCKAGHYGDPSKLDGCFECHCNDHGDPELGVCHNETGVCFCMDNTLGLDCQDCLDGYYGDPHDGGKCYLSCDHGMIVNNITQGSLGSHKGPGVSTWKAYCMWIMTIAQDLDRAATLLEPPTVTVGIEDLAVECERDHVYVYDGIPKFIDSTGDGVLLGAFCGFFSREFHSVIAKSGIVTIYFNADISGNYSLTRGFNASYHINECEDRCLASDNRHCVDGSCVCLPGYSWPDCKNRTCQAGCTYDEATESCECEANFGGASYHISSFSWTPVTTASNTAPPTPVSRYGHTIIHCDDTVMYMFGGRSLQHGLLNDIWLYSFATHTWTEIIPITSDQPAGRYFHAGACVPVIKNLYIFGGVVQSKGGNLEYEASKEMWKFAIDARKWSGPIQPAWVMGMAGHSMTLVEETKLVIIGGFSTLKYFSDTVYEFDANSYLTAWQTHKWENITGAKPTGLYGHSAVYNEASKTIYVYGGHVYRQETLFVSDRLFTYDIIKKSWNILQPEKNSEVEPRYFHTAVGFDDYMAIVGGYTQHRNTSEKILIYKFRCNYWYTLDLSGTPLGKVLTSLLATKSVVYDNSIILTGGYNNTLNNLVYKITLPDDLCTLSSDFNTCTLVYGCAARVVHHANGENVTLCNRNDRQAPESTLGPVIQTNSGTVCNINWHAQRDCESITECSECIAMYPQFKSSQRSCHWCAKCSIGKCLRVDQDCKNVGENKCMVYTQHMLVAEPLKMSCSVPCTAATCDRCSEMDCIWSQHYRRVLNTAGGVKWMQSRSPTFDWSCVLKSLQTSLEEYDVFMVPPNTCPAPCYVHTTCGECLDSRGGEGGSQECYWSEILKECLPPAYLSLRCLAGECGTVLQGGAQKCPLPCEVHKQCGDCRKAPGCGWCAFGGLNGLGVCMEGTRSGPRGQCEVNNVSYEDRALAEEDIEVFMRSKSAPTWAYATCPPEDECSNGHHSCDVNTQNCKDTLEGFICECKEGYIWNEEVGECTPVCHQGCVHGTCTLPDTCRCNFGFVGKNCSTECECNGHSNCKSVEKKNVCLECKNHTQGRSCQECKPLFVGNPRNGGKCVSCTEFCNNHTDICLKWTEYNGTYNHIQRLRAEIPDTTSPEFHARIAEYLPRGPADEGKTYCVDCEHHTYMSKCEECRLGYFRLSNMSPAEPCTKCMCNGHSEICDQKGGQNCQCKNNTETKCSAEVKLKIACHEVQCAVCKEYFLGTPTDGHQCYRQMNVNREYCFDPITQNDCTRSPDPLLHGHTVFFAVQPKYVNVDIRVTIDVTQGGIDVYFSPRDKTFTVDVDKITGVHTVRLDSNEHFISLEDQLVQQANSDLSQRNTRIVRSMASNSTIISDHTYVMHEKKASDLNTFITVENPDTILLIRNVQYRLVITLPCELLDLRTSRFYMIFVSRGDNSRNESYGSLYFRQDQPHIDLFVFFSVFFSCFFLFLAMCVLLWKTKQAFDTRRSRQQRAREMLHMASRPFAKVLVLIEHLSPFNVSPNLSLLRSVKNTARTPLLPSETSLPSSPVIVRHSFDIIPIAIEPTDDGVAGVVSVVFQLPGGAAAPSQLCLGSTLTKGYQLSHTAGKHRRLPASSQC